METSKENLHKDVGAYKVKRKYERLGVRLGILQKIKKFFLQTNLYLPGARHRWRKCAELKSVPCCFPVFSWFAGELLLLLFQDSTG